MGIVLYLAIMFSGNLIAMNVAVEKSTRIAEVLLAVLRPSQILVGNVLGIGLLTLAQLLVLAVPGHAGPGGGRRPGPARRSPIADIGLGVAWFVLGYLIYAFLFAATAALVDKVTEVGSAIHAGDGGADPGLPRRRHRGVAEPGIRAERRAVDVPADRRRWRCRSAGPRGRSPDWQLMVSMELAVAAAVLLAWFGSSVYRRALVVTGRRLKLREALNAGSR